MDTRVGWWPLLTSGTADGSFLVDLQGDVEVAVAFEVVAVGVEDGGVLVAERFVAFLVVIREAAVTAASDVEFDLVAGEDDEGNFGALAVVLLAVVWQRSMPGISVYS